MADSYYPELAGILLRLGRKLAEKTGLGFAFINLSGGIGIPYRPGEPEVDIRKVGQEIRRIYEDVCPEGDVAVKSELDNYMASGQDLASAIQSV